MARRILAWECKYCGAIKKNETIALRHEVTCLKNPDARNCILCIFSFRNEQMNKLVCRKGKICSRAISASCEYFRRKEEDAQE